VAEASYPEDLKYHPEHDWARIDGDTATFGITWYAQDALGEVVHAELPAVGDTVQADASYGELESVKAVSDITAPLGGEVVEVNEKIAGSPELVNDETYEGGWLIRVRLADAAAAADLLDATAYQEYLAAL
jgi:glycine cleavage system H protein